MEYRLRCGDGKYRWIRGQGTPDFGPGKKVCGYTGTALVIPGPGVTIAPPGGARKILAAKN